jgi:hypothetical protein
MDAARCVFLDATTTAMARRYGRSSPGTRLVAACSTPSRPKNTPTTLRTQATTRVPPELETLQRPIYDRQCDNAIIAEGTDWRLLERTTALGR